MKPLLSRILCLLILSTAGAAEGDGDRWRRFRGPNGSGTVEGVSAPASWADSDRAWQLTLPGSGNSSPVVWDGRVFVTCADTDSGHQHLCCVELNTGRLLWQRQFEFTAYRKHKNNSFASNTPAVDENHVYLLRQLPDKSPVTAWTHEGEPVWEADLGPYRHGQGGGTSPVVYGRLLVISNDHGQGSCLIALDRKTGAEVWRIPREGKRACYSTPCVLKLEDGREQLVFTHCFEGIVGVDPARGTVEWHIDVFGDFPQRAVGSPFVAAGMVFANSGAAAGDKNLVAVKTDGKHVEEVYRLERGAPHVPTAIARGPWVFSWADNGIVTCIEAATGRKVWTKRVGGNYFASPICLGEQLICPDLDGEVVILRASAEYEVLGRNALDAPTRATPAYASGLLLLRTDESLIAIRCQ